MLTTAPPAWATSNQGRFKLFPIATDEHLLAAMPMPLGRNWTNHVNEPQRELEELTLQACFAWGKPFGSAAWTKKIAKQLNLESTLRPRG